MGRWRKKEKMKQQKWYNKDWRSVDMLLLLTLTVFSTYWILNIFGLISWVALW